VVTAPAGGEAAAVPALVVDATGRRCPLPIIDLAGRIGDVAVGAVVALLADDPAAAADVPAWCRMRGHGYLGSPGPHEYRVRRDH
jgi:TusA-related sulfurtransferase